MTHLTEGPAVLKPCFPWLYRKRTAQLFQPSIVVIANIAQRFVRLLGDIPERQSVKEDHLNRASLDFIEGCKRLFYCPGDFWTKELRPGRHCIRPIRISDLRAVIELAQEKIISAVHAAVVGILQQPHFKTAF